MFLFQIYQARPHIIFIQLYFLWWEQLIVCQSLCWMGFLHMLSIKITYVWLIAYDHSSLPYSEVPLTCNVIRVVNFKKNGQKKQTEARKRKVLYCLQLVRHGSEFSQQASNNNSHTAGCRLSSAQWQASCSWTLAWRPRQMCGDRKRNTSIKGKQTGSENTNIGWEY